MHEGFPACRKAIIQKGFHLLEMVYDILCDWIFHIDNQVPLNWEGVKHCKHKLLFVLLYLLKFVYKMRFDHVGLNILANTNNVCDSMLFQVSTL